MMQSSSLTEPEKSIPAPDGCFLMWRDYMDLRRTLSQLLEQRDQEQAAVQRGTPPEGFMRTGSTSSVSSASASISSRDLRIQRDTCGFCRQNGETPLVYMSHRLKARDGRILCPILRSYVCPFCSATGDWAHTRHYCPLRNAPKTSNM